MRRWSRLPGFRLLLVLTAVVCIALQGFGSLRAAPLALRPVAGVVMPSGLAIAPIPIEQQPFYPELQRAAGAWSDVVLNTVVGDSPRHTLLNFYAVMAEVGRRSEQLGRPRSGPEDSRSASEREEQISDTDLLFQLAVKALDASSFPESVRVDMAEEAAIQLKHVLDYVFSHSLQPIDIPDAVGMKVINDRRTSPSESWRIPGTAITLTSILEDHPENENYLFSAETVAGVHEMYREIRDYPVVEQPFATPEFFQDFVYTPGYLVPPDWYLALPSSLRRVLEVPIDDQTLFQIACVVLALLLFLTVLLWLIRLLLDSYRDQPRRGKSAQAWNLDALAWRRFLILMPLLPLTRLVKTFVDDVVNLTGLPLVIATYFF